MTPKQAGLELTKIISKLKSGADYAECKKEAEPVLKIINQRAEELAKKFSVKPRKVSFTSLAR